MGSEKSEKKSEGKKKKNIFLIIGLSIVGLVLLVILILFFAGGQGKIDDGLPETGIVAIDVPYSAEGKEEFTVQWILRGVEKDSAVVSGVYFGMAPSQADFSMSPPPDQTGYESMVAYNEITLENGMKSMEANVPNIYDVNYVRIYAKINGKDYWSNEFMVLHGENK